MTKHDREIMEILEAFDLTNCAHSAAELVGVDAKTVARYVAARDAGGDAFARVVRPKLIDPYLEKIEELVERSKGKVRADVVHQRHLVPMGFSGDERTTRRAVAVAKEHYAAGHQHLSSLDPRARHVGPVRLGHRPCGPWPQDLPVLRVARLEPVPGRHPDVGPHPADRTQLHRRHAPPVRRCAHLPAHRQRADGHDRPRLRPRGPPPAHGGGRSLLWPVDRHLYPLRPRDQGLGN